LPEKGFSQISEFLRDLEGNSGERLELVAQGPYVQRNGDEAGERMTENDVEKDPEMMTIIAFSGDLDKLWPTMILASTAAANGMNVTIFFTFWGLFPLVRDDVRITGNDAKTKLLSAMNPPGMKKAHLSKLKMGGMGRWMMRKVAKKNNLMPPEDLFAICQDMGVSMWPCQMTMDLMGIEPEQMVDGLGEPAGAATALARMSKSEISLFI
jgi:peroxiredoxin family protein